MSGVKEIRQRGKSRANDIVREWLKEKGMEPCPLCKVEGAWDIFHTPGKPCPKITTVQPIATVTVKHE